MNRTFIVENLVLNIFCSIFFEKIINYRDTSKELIWGNFNPPHSFSNSVERRLVYHSWGRTDTSHGEYLGEIKSGFHFYSPSEHGVSLYGLIREVYGKWTLCNQKLTFTIKKVKNVRPDTSVLLQLQPELICSHLKLIIQEYINSRLLRSDSGGQKFQHLIFAF